MRYSALAVEVSCCHSWCSSNESSFFVDAILEFYRFCSSACRNMFQKIVSDIDSIESEMLEQCPEIRKMLDQYRNKNGKLAGMEIETAFSKGFRLGAPFMIDVFGGKE